MTLQESTNRIIFIHHLISLNMKKINLTFREWFVFKQIATFMYEYAINKECVVVKADSYELELLGY